MDDYHGRHVECTPGSKRRRDKPDRRDPFAQAPRPERISPTTSCFRPRGGCYGARSSGAGRRCCREIRPQSVRRDMRSRRCRRRAAGLTSTKSKPAMSCRSAMAFKLSRSSDMSVHWAQPRRSRHQRHVHRVDIDADINARTMQAANPRRLPDQSGGTRHRDDAVA